MHPPTFDLPPIADRRALAGVFRATAALHSQLDAARRAASHFRVENAIEQANEALNDIETRLRETAQLIHEDSFEAVPNPSRDERLAELERLLRLLPRPFNHPRPVAWVLTHSDYFQKLGIYDANRAAMGADIRLVHDDGLTERTGVAAAARVLQIRLDEALILLGQISQSAALSYITQLRSVEASHE